MTFRKGDIWEAGDIVVDVGTYDSSRGAGKYVVLYERQADGSLKLAVDAHAGGLASGLRANNAQHCVHALLAVVCYCAPEQVSARRELQLAVDDMARLHAGKPDDPRASDATQVEVVRVLAAVDELDDHSTGPHPGAGEAVAEFLCDHLDTRRRVLGYLRSEDHATSFGREKEAACGITAAASTPNHCSRRAE